MKDLYPGEVYYVGDLTNVNGVLYFFAGTASATYPQIWKSDGTEAGTVVVSDFANPKYDNVSEVGWNTTINSINGMFYFGFGWGTSIERLWKSDGTEEGTTLIKNLNQ